MFIDGKKAILVQSDGESYEGVWGQTIMHITPKGLEELEQGSEPNHLEMDEEFKGEFIESKIRLDDIVDYWNKNEGWKGIG